MKAYSSEKVIENLKDAGCTPKQIKELMQLYDEGKKEDVCKILAKHRKNVLDNVHKNEKQIDCIDYFVYHIEMEEKENE